MKTHAIFFILLVGCIILCNTACRKHILDNGLPPATQEGKNTLGFLLNGKPWIPKGFNGTANLSMNFDLGYKNGVFDIASYQIISDNNREYFGIGMADSLNFITVPVTLSLSNQSLFRMIFSNNKCDYFSTDSDTYVAGSLTISKLDTTTDRVIISGKFNATLYKPNCGDTIKITEGRFDMSLH